MYQLSGEGFSAKKLVAWLRPPPITALALDQIRGGPSGRCCFSFAWPAATCNSEIPAYAERGSIRDPVWSSKASLAQLVEHALRKHMVMGSSPIGGSYISSSTSLKICTNRSVSLLRGRLALLPAAQHSLLWGSSPWPYAYRAHALPAELRRPCRQAMELTCHVSRRMTRVQNLKKKYARTLTAQPCPLSSALHNSSPALLNDGHCLPWILLSGSGPLFIRPHFQQSSRHPFPAQNQNFFALAASTIIKRALAAGKCPSSSSKHVEVLLNYNRNVCPYSHCAAVPAIIRLAQLARAAEWRA